MMMFKYVLITVVFLLSVASAKAACPTGSTCVPLLSGSYPYTGNNSTYGLNYAVPDTTACPSGQGTLIPKANVEQCTLAGNLTMALPSPFTPDQPINEFLVENATGGYTVTPCATCLFLPAQLNANGTVAMSVGSSAQNLIHCDTATVGTTNEMFCSVSAGFISAVTPSVIANVMPSANTGSGGATAVASSAGLAMTTGDTLIVYDYGYGNSSSSAAKPNAAAPTIASGTLGTCALFTGSRISGETGDFGGTEAWQCPITSGASAVVTGHWAAACYFCDFVAIDVRNLNATAPDAGIGNTANGNSAAPSVATNGGGTSGKNYLYLTSMTLLGTESAGPPGWTNLVASTGIGWFVWYEVVPSGSVVTATAAQTSNYWNASIVGGTP